MIVLANYDRSRNGVYTNIVYELPRDFRNAFHFHWNPYTQSERNFPDSRSNWQIGLSFPVTQILKNAFSGPVLNFLNIYPQYYLFSSTIRSVDIWVTKFNSKSRHVIVLRW